MDIRFLKEHKTKALLSFAIPSIISMLLETVIYYGRLVYRELCRRKCSGSNQSGIAGAVFFLGVGLCIGVGESVICGKLLGAEDHETARKVFSQTIITALIVSIGASLLFALLLTPILKILHADDELTGYFIEYYRIMLLAYPLMIISTILGMFICVDGKPQFCMLVSIIGCVLNAVLDYIMVASLKMDIRGSAAATLFVQIVTAALQIVYFFGKGRDIRFCRFRFDRDMNRDTLFNGFSEFIGDMASAISMFAFNFHGESLDFAEGNESLISIEQLEDLLVVYERRKGNYHNLDYEWYDFIKRYEYLSTDDTLYLDCTIV